MRINDIRIKNIKDIKNNKLFLPNSDLIFTPFDFTLVFNEILNEKKLMKSLKILIEKYYFLTGRVKFDGLKHYIEVTENFLPFSYLDDYKTKQFSSDTNESIVKPFLGQFVESVAFNPTNVDEPLLKIVFTKIHNSKESVLGISWNHVLGDIKTIYNFVDVFNKIYKDCSFEVPYFDKYTIYSNELENIKEEKLKQIEESLIYNKFQKTWWVIPQILWDMLFVSNMLVLNFTSKEINILKEILNNEIINKNKIKIPYISTYDVVVSYIIKKINDVVAEEDKIKYIVNTIEYRNILNIDSKYFGNPVGIIKSKEIKNYNFLDIAINNRESIEIFKNKEYLKNYIYKKEKYIQNNFNYGMPNPLPYYNEIFINSYHKVDFRKVNFGTGFARYYDTFSANYFMRIFKKNPYKINNSWVNEEDSLEVNIRLPKKYYNKIKYNIYLDKELNFKNI